MLTLNLNLPDNIYSEMMLECRNIPCLVRINNIFNIDFFDFYKAMLPVKDINHCKKAMNLPIVLRKSLTK